MNPPRFHLSVAVCLFVLATGFGVGCQVEVGSDDGPPVDRVQAVFDPEAETIPLPSDLALDEEGTVPDLEGIEGEDANGEFLRWLTTLHGWLPATAIEIPFDGRLDPETVTAENVKLFRFEGEGEFEELEVAEATYEEAQVAVTRNGESRQVDGSRVTIVPAQSLSTHEEYGAVVTKDVMGVRNGERNAVVEPRPIFFAGSNDPLVDEEGNKTIESLPDDETAQQLEDLRQFLNPVYRAVEDRKIVAMVTRWSTVRDPQTILDPESGTIPQPNKAATDPDGTPLEAAFDSIDEESAQGHFERYLARLRGWPPTAPIELPIAGEVDAETVDRNTVQLWRFTGESDPAIEQVELESVDYDAESGRVRLTPSESLGKRERFLAFATDDIEGPNEWSLKLPAALKMAIQPEPVVEGSGEERTSTVGRLSDEQAKSIDDLRSFLQPAVETLESETDVSRDQLGALWTWETWKDTFAVFDPSTGDIPLPNEFARRGMEGRVSLPTGGLSGLQQQVVEQLNERRGFSTTAPGWIRFDAPVDQETLTKSNLLFLFNSGTPRLYDPSRYELDYRPDWSRVITRPTVPWNRDSSLDPTSDDILNLAVLTKDVEDAEGNAVMPSPAFVFLRSPDPLFSGGSSTVDQLDDSTAQALETARRSFNLLFGLAEAGQVEGVEIEDRTEISLAYGFHPENPVQPAQEFRAQAAQKLAQRGSSSVGRACEQNGNCGSDPNEVDDPGANYQGPDGMGDAVDMSNVRTIQWAAEFDTVDFIQPGGSMGNFSEAAAEPVGASVFVPKDSNCPNKNPNANSNEEFRVVIAQHGLGSHRVASGMALANALAGECLALVATDFPKHGGRAPGASTLHPETLPPSSGQNFLSVDLNATRSNLLQGIVDLTVLAQIIRDDGLERAIDGDSNTDFFAFSADSADPGDGGIGYVGLSLGGFIGLPAATIDSNITAEVFTATGGGYSDVLTDGTLGGGILSALQQAGLEEGSFERFQALAFIQWIAGQVDPLAFAPFLREDPLDTVTFDSSSEEFSKGEEMDPNEVLLQMATNPNEGDDLVVPNATTRRLADSAGLSLSDSTYRAPHGFLFQTDSSSTDFPAAECAREQAAVWLANGLEGEASFPDRLKPSNCVN